MMMEPRICKRNLRLKVSLDTFFLTCARNFRIFFLDFECASRRHASGGKAQILFCQLGACKKREMIDYLGQEIRPLIKGRWV